MTDVDDRLKRIERLVLGDQGEGVEHVEKTVILGGLIRAMLDEHVLVKQLMRKVEELDDRTRFK
jgi:hypothetical protein